MKIQTSTQQTFLYDEESQNSSLKNIQISQSSQNTLNFCILQQNQKQKFIQKISLKTFLTIFGVIIVSIWLLLIIQDKFFETDLNKEPVQMTLQQIQYMTQNPKNSEGSLVPQSTIQLKQQINKNNLKVQRKVKTLSIADEFVTSGQFSEKQHFQESNKMNSIQAITKQPIIGKQAKQSTLYYRKINPSAQRQKFVQNLSKKQQQNYNSNHFNNVDQNQKQHKNQHILNVIRQNQNIQASVPLYRTNFLPPAIHGINSQQVAQAKQFLQLKNKQGENPIAKKQRAYYQQRYRIFQYETQLPICVVIPSYNNIQNDRYKNNLNSILQQQYKNYHIVFIDDGSTDQTYNKTQEMFVQKKFEKSRVRMIRNQVQKFAMHNLRRAAMEFCKPQEIFIIVDGDDQLIGRQVFKLYNAFFQNTGAYYVYSNFLISKNEEVGYSCSIPLYIKSSNSYRTYPFVVSHLRAFYTKLFQLVDEKDLKNDDGNYFRAANDVAMSLPILQMAGQKVEYFPQLTYFYNSATGYNNHVIRTSQQRSNDKLVRGRHPYQKVDNLFQDIGQ